MLQRITEGFMPHGMCYLWKPELLWLHVISDALISGAYFAIPIALATMVWRGRSVLADVTPSHSEEGFPYAHAFLAFAIFILACGVTHVIAIWTVWQPVYWISGAVKGITAIASVATASMLPPMVPRVLALLRDARISDARRVELEKAEAERKRLEGIREARERAERERARAELERELAERERTQLEAHNAELRDLTATLRRRNDELDRFAYAASHDLRAPLRGIGSLATWLEEDLDPHLSAQHRDHLRLMRNRVERMDAMVNGLLEFARVGGEAEEPQRIDVRWAVGEIADLLPRPEGVSLEIEGSVPPVVTEATPLRQVLHNLLANAFKHANESVVVALEETPDGGLEIRIRDDGAGIEPRYHDRIWEIFKRLEARDEVEGTGIGLALVRKIVEERGGRVWVESRPGAGAMFAFTWPARGRAAA